MAKVMERVQLDRVLPLVDEFGNEYLNRDYSLDVNRQYVSELAASFKDGEPDEPIVVVRDGDVFRVKAGNSRVRAMKELGTRECWAIVDDEGTEQAINETVVRTNVKKKYELLEESRFVQQLAMFGDDEYVGHVSGIGAEKAAQVRRARAVAGDKAMQMSLERLMAVDEFDGYPELQRKVLDADDEHLLRMNLDGYRREKRNAEQRKAFEAEAAKLGIELVGDRPEGPKQYILDCKDPEQLASKYMEASARFEGIVGRLCSYWSGAYVDFYGTPLDQVAEKEAAEEAELRRKAKELDDVLDSIDQSTLAWVRGILDTSRNPSLKPETRLRKMPGLCEAARERYYDQYYVEQGLKLIPEAKGYMLNFIPAFASGYSDARRENCRYGAQIAGTGKLAAHVADRIERYMDWIGLHKADGWEPDKEQAKALRAVERRLGRAEGGQS